MHPLVLLSVGANVRNTILVPSALPPPTQSTSRRSLQHHRRYCAHRRLFSLAWPRLLRPVQPGVEAVDERLRARKKSVGSTRLPFGRRRRSFSWRALKLVTNASLSLARIAGYESSRDEDLQHHHLLPGSDPSTRKAHLVTPSPLLSGSRKTRQWVGITQVEVVPGWDNCALFPPPPPGRLRVCS